MKRALISRLAFSAGLLALVGACTMKDQDAPPLTGPSEFGKSITVSVTPDVLEQNGASQSVISVNARGPNGEPLSGVALRVSTEVGGTAVDFGSLSARSIATGNDGRATAVYTAPAAPSVTTDDFIVVQIVITPVGSDFFNTALRTAAIRLVPPGVVLPPDGLKPSFTMTPTAASENQTVLFDASASLPIGGIAEYRWDFGDGRSGSGRTTTHEFSTAGTYAVTLTIVDGFNRAASTVQSINIGQGAAPTAAFVFSPTNPLPVQPVFFNASASRPAPGRTLVSYAWDFGDGTSGSGVQPNHTYAVAGGYNVTLVVTDDVGRTATTTQEVTVGADDPTADFSFAPTSPARLASVAFNGSASRAVPGRTIVSYTWTFGGNATPLTASGQATAASFPTAGTFNVTLTVVDSAGKSGSITKPITVVP